MQSPRRTSMELLRPRVERSDQFTHSVTIRPYFPQNLRDSANRLVLPSMNCRLEYRFKLYCVVITTKNRLHQPWFVNPTRLKDMSDGPKFFTKCDEYAETFQFKVIYSTYIDNKGEQLGVYSFCIGKLGGLHGL